MRLEMAASPPTDDVVAHLGAGLMSYLTSSAHSDLIVLCNDDRYNVHKIVLCSQSKWFAKACEGPFMEGSSGVIELDEDDPILVRTMLTYMYSLDYSDATEQSLSKGISPIRMNVLLYAMADKYGIPPLKRLSAQKFEKLAKAQWDRDSFPPIIRAVYESTASSDRGLRDIVVSIVARYAKVLLSIPQQPPIPGEQTKDVPQPVVPQPAKNGFAEVVEQVGGFGRDLAVKMSTNMDPDELRFRCPKCKGTWRGKVPTISASHCPYCDHNPDGWTNYVVD